ncbi:MAG: hypothetical protein JST11_14030 [Acidobacteria bacterium]|nr:hypothetical protein [Acidobacteriota bacterium]
MRTLAIFVLAVTAVAAAAERYVGTVAKVETSPPSLLIQLDGGGQKWVAVPPETPVLRIAPGEKDLSRATKLAFGDVRAGDRILARAEGEPGIAGQILMLSQGDLAQKQQAEREDWKRRGISGKVISVNSEAGEIAITTATREGAAAVVIQTGGATELRRYRSDSARFGDARPATIRDIRDGDQLQAVGERSPDGRTLRAEKIVSGSFHNFTARIETVNAAEQALLVRTSPGDPPVAVKIAPGSILRRLSAEAASQLAGQKRGKTAAAGNVLEGSLALTVNELQPGDAVVIATVDGTGGTGANVAAIAVIAGVEPLLKRSAEAQREVLGSWSLSLDPESSGDRGGGR